MTLLSQIAEVLRDNPQAATLSRLADAVDAIARCPQQAIDMARLFVDDDDGWVRVEWNIPNGPFVCLDIQKEPYIYFQPTAESKGGIDKPANGDMLIKRLADTFGWEAVAIAE